MICLLRAYQKVISPLISRRIACRFHPTCSEYAILAIQKYGCQAGLRKTWRRLLRCRSDNFDSCIDLP
ncbi:MAG: membrane protein insertion efficiency factor YidD [Candidatus Omnitrophota bacterium]